MSKTLILDSRICKTSVETLSQLGYEFIFLSSNKCFDEPISAHPDIFITKVKDTWFADMTVKDLFTFSNEINFIEREAGESEKVIYPNDCSFNCVSVGNNLICNEKITDKRILDFAKTNGLNIIHTNQGYSKCSICKVGENAIITEDTNIYNISVKNGIDALLVEKGHVKLDGYNYGFIGGCTGLIENNLLAVNGNICKHPNCKEIIEFCESHDVQILYLNNDQLYDIGSIFRI